MGSFNVKCSLTGMDIVAGDPIVVLLGIVPTNTPYEGGYRGQSGVFHPRTVPIRGCYDDYGWVEDVAPENMALALKVLELFFPGEINPNDLRSEFVRHSWDKPDGRAVAFVHGGAWDALLETFRDYPFDTTLRFHRDDVKAYPEHISGEYVWGPRTTRGSFDMALDFLARHPLGESQEDDENTPMTPDEQALYDCWVSRGKSSQEAREIATFQKIVARMRRSLRDTPEAGVVFASLMVSSMFPWPREIARNPEKAHPVLHGLIPIIRENPQAFMDLDTVMSGAMNCSRKAIRPHQDMPTAAQWIEDEMRMADKALAHWTLHYYKEMRPSEEE